MKWAVSRLKGFKGKAKEAMESDSGIAAQSPAFILIISKGRLDPVSAFSLPLSHFRLHSRFSPLSAAVLLLKNSPETSIRCLLSFPTHPVHFFQQFKIHFIASTHPCVNYNSVVSPIWSFVTLPNFSLKPKYRRKPAFLSHQQTHLSLKVVANKVTLICNVTFFLFP